jgi:hypothetical protein
MRSPGKAAVPLLLKARYSYYNTVKEITKIDRDKNFLLIGKNEGQQRI